MTNIESCHTCSLCRVELVVQFPARGLTQVLLCLFPGVLWLWHFLYSVGPHPVSSLHIYTFVVSRAFMAGAASQAGDADSSRAPGLTSGLQGSVNVHRGALLLVPQWQCISSFVFYITEFPLTLEFTVISIELNHRYMLNMLVKQMFYFGYIRVFFLVERFPLLSTVHNYRHLFKYCPGYRERNLFGFLLIFHHKQLYLRTSSVSVTSSYTFSKTSRSLRYKGTFHFREWKWIIIA